jgi:RNA polymerase sigma-70 factor (ECF subfamily)
MQCMAARTRLIDWLAPFAAPASEVNWDALYTRELPRVYNFFRYRVGDGAVAEDLTSTTFEKAWRARARYSRDAAAFSTWLFTIARNVATDHFRQRRAEVPLEEAAAESSLADSPEQSAIRRADFERLSALLAGLSARERELLALKYGSGLTNREIARVTGLSESNVGTILHRTVAALRIRW